MLKLKSKKQIKLDNELINAVIDGDSNRLIDLLNTGANPNVISKEGSPIIYSAFKNDDLCNVEYLLRYGADLDFIKCKEVLELKKIQEIADLVICAIEDGCHVLAVFILDHVGSADFRSPVATDFVNFACMNFCSEIIDYAVERGYDINSLSSYGQAAIHVTVQGLDYILLENLIGDYNADINIQNVDGQTALHIAVDVENMDAVVILVEHGADMFIRDNNGETAMDIAVRNNCEEISEYLKVCSRSPKIKRILGKIK